jgi:F0F1-type ATP synthase membrane subunit b/b'
VLLNISLEKILVVPAYAGYLSEISERKRKWKKTIKRKISELMKRKTQMARSRSISKMQKKEELRFATDEEFKEIYDEVMKEAEKQIDGWAAQAKADLEAGKYDWVDDLKDMTDEEMKKVLKEHGIELRLD